MSSKTPRTNAALGDVIGAGGELAPEHASLVRTSRALEEERDALYAACKAAMECCGSSVNWNGKTAEFLLLMEAAVAKAEGLS